MQARVEVTAKYARAYAKSSKKERGRLLDEVVVLVHQPLGLLLGVTLDRGGDRHLTTDNVDPHGASFRRRERRRLNTV